MSAVRTTKILTLAEAFTRIERLEKILQDQDASAPPLGRGGAIMCGGCGAAQSDQRCIGCLHDFGDDASAWVCGAPAPPVPADREGGR